MQVKGRHLVVAWTLIFGAAFAMIIRREHQAWTARNTIDSAQHAIRELDARRSTLQGEIADLESFEKLQPKAQALGLHSVSDSDFIQLTVPR